MTNWYKTNCNPCFAWREAQKLYSAHWQICILPNKVFIGENSIPNFTLFDFINNYFIRKFNVSLRSKVWLYASVHLIESSHDLNNQTVSHTDVFIALLSEHKTEDLRRVCWPQFESKGFCKFFCPDFHK